MLHIPNGSNTFGLSLASWGTTRPAAANGASVTPGSGSWGSWVQLGSDLTEDVYGILININSNYTSAASRGTIINIGVDLAGGTSFTTVIPNLLCGNADTYSSGGRSGTGHWYYFPLFIKAGAAVGVQGYSSVATAFRVGCIFYQRPACAMKVGSFVESIGISAPNGTSITPGTTSEGSWTSIGSNTLPLWWWQIGVQVPSTDTSHNAGAVHFDLAVGDGSNYDIIFMDLCIQPSASESITSQLLMGGVEWYVPSGKTLYVRAQHAGTAETMQVAVYGMGG